MIPDLISVGPVTIHSFGLMVALAIVAGLKLATKSFSRLGLPVQHAESIVFVAGISGILGARFWSMFVYERGATFNDPLGTLLSSGGFVFHGGLIISALCTAYFIRRRGLSIPIVADALGPALMLGYGIGRLGCQLSGDGDYGAPTTSIFGMSYSTGYIPTPPGQFVYPTPFFESLMAFASLYILLKLEREKHLRPGKRFAAMMILMGACRFLIEFIRVEPMMAIGITEAQLVSIILVGIGIFIALPFSRRRDAHS